MNSDTRTKAVEETEKERLAERDRDRQTQTDAVRNSPMQRQTDTNRRCE